MTPPVAIAVAVPGATSSAGAWPQAITSALSARTAAARLSLGAQRVGGAHREAVDVGAIERRRIDRRDHVVREHAAERVGKRHRLARRAARDRAAARSARCASSARDDFEELLLPRGAADRIERSRVRRELGDASLMATALTATGAPAE